MIIKKKYAKVSSSAEKIEKEQQLTVEEQQSVSQDAAEEVQNVKEEEKEVIADESVQDTSSPHSLLDLSINDIDFEPRAERREGTRRRGYRRTQDRNIVSRAQQEAQSIKEAARQEGYKEGINNAAVDINNLKSKLSEFYNYKDVVFGKVSECIYDISVEIAKKIINKQIETDKSSLLSIIKTAVKEVNKTEEKITLKVMPKDVEIVRDNLPEIFSDNSFEAKISVIPDGNIKEGGVIIETSNGIIDATIETQIAIIEKALKTGTENQEQTKEEN